MNKSNRKYIRGQTKEKPYKFVVRLPTEMRDRIAEAAEYYRRSMNSEIVARLYHSFSGIIDDATEDQLQPPLHPQLEKIFRRELSEDEEHLLRSYRRLSSDKRDALLQLLT